MRDKYEAAVAALRKCLPKDMGGAKAEYAFAQAYQALVRAGEAPQLRQRMRP